MSVIKEIPIFLNKSAKDDLLLFEYPNRPKQHRVNDLDVIECKYKPEHQHVELSLSVSGQSGNYERHRGQELGQVAPEFFDSGRYDRQLLRSQPAVGHQRQQETQQKSHSQLAVGTIRNGQLCICPLGAQLVLKPAFDYLNQQQLQQQQQQAAAAAEGAEAKAVTVRFARNETPEARLRREQGFRACQRELDMEPWLRCSWIGEAQQLPLAVTDSSQVPIATNCNAAYLGSLSPAPTQSNSADSWPETASATVSLARLKAMPCPDRLRALLKSACVLRWHQIIDLLKQCGMTHHQLNESHDQILGHLTDLACLVRGVWVVKSEVLYPAGTVSGHCGVPAQAMCRGRDYILCRFVQGRAVSRKEIASLVKLPSEETSEILAKIARQIRRESAPGSNKAPKLKLVFAAIEDADYVRRNPEVVQLAINYWETKWKLLTDYLKLDKVKALRDRGLMGGESPSIARRSRTRSARYSSSSSSDCGSDLEPEPSGRQRRSSFSRRQCVSMSEGEFAMPKLPSKLPAKHTFAAPAPAPVAEAMASVPGVSSELLASARNFIGDKLRDRLIASFDELHRFFRFQRLPPGASDGADAGGIDDAALCLAVFDAAARSLDDVFVLSSRPSEQQEQPQQPQHRIYAFAPDLHRQLLLRHLSNNQHTTLANLRAMCDSAGIVNVNDNGLKAAIKDYCTFRGKAYYLKGHGVGGSSS